MNDLYNVYDLFCPSPLALEKIATIKVAIELWREEIRKHCPNGTLKGLNFEETILSNVQNSNLPESIRAIIEGYIKSVGLSIKEWIKCHTDKQIFELEILNSFHDFVGDFDGSIDYEKTARKMVFCDGISQDEKFKIACLYCFRDQIVRLWPAVSTRMDLSEISFEKSPHLFFYICCLRKQPYMVPLENLGRNVGKSLFDHFMRRGVFFSSYPVINWPYIKYVFDRVGLEERMSYVTQIFSSYPQEFYRYVLAKLNKCELVELLTKNRSEFWNSAFLFYNLSSSRTHKLFSIWMYVKDEMKKIEFSKVIHRALFIKPIPGIASDEPSIGCKIYSSVPDNFKRHAIERAVLNSHHFGSRNSQMPILYCDVSLLLTALSDALDHEREAYLKKHWSEFIFVMNIDEFRQFVTLCFKNEEEIDHFRETHLSNYEIMGPHFLRLFSGAKFGKLNDLISYCFTEERMRDIQLRLLSDDFNLNDELMKEPRALNEFINDAFNDADRATEFKNQLLSKPSIVEKLRGFVNSGYDTSKLRAVREFLDTVISKQVAKNFKMQKIWPVFWSRFYNGLFHIGYEGDYDIKFLRWCLENEDGNVETSLAIIYGDAIIHAVLRHELWRKNSKTENLLENVRTPLTYHPVLVEFLKWYSVTSEAYENLVAKYADNVVFTKLIEPNDQNA